MGAVITLLLFAAALAALSALLFCGKCSRLIAGYNTLPDREKEKYDEKKLCRAMGALLLVITVLLLAMAYLGYKVETGAMAEGKMLPFAVFFVGCTLSVVGAVLYYTNNKCKK